MIAQTRSSHYEVASLRAVFDPVFIVSLIFVPQASRGGWAFRATNFYFVQKMVYMLESHR
jgi:hypothetical protein